MSSVLICLIYFHWFIGCHPYYFWSLCFGWCLFSRQCSSRGSISTYGGDNPILTPFYIHSSLINFHNPYQPISTMNTTLRQFHRMENGKPPISIGFYHKWTSLIGGFKHEFHFPFHIYGMSSFPLTNSIIFQDGYCTTNQKLYIIAIENGPVEIVDFPMKNGDFP